MKAIASLCAICLIFAQLDAQIVETTTFREIVSHIDKDTLILLDIDDTLLVPQQMLGCDVWFQSQLAKHREQGIAPTAALEQTIAEWESIRHLTKMEIVESGTDEIVRELQQQGYTLMGLTTQGLSLATRTSFQLQELGFSLVCTAPATGDLCFSNDGHTVLFRQGILFTSGSSKGKALFRFCEEIGYSPRKIVFINDKASHLRDVESAAEERGVDFVGLRYAYSDARKAAYRPDIAQFQYKHSTFDHLLTDEEAIALMKN